jgi:tetratricopeptide (TPR) repeat protein
MKLIIDYKNNVVYTTPSVRDPDVTFDYNRLGAVFITNYKSRSSDFTAHVVKGSPADEAGIRDGDIVLRVNYTEVAEWRNNPTIQPYKIWEQAPGTQLKFLLKRGGATFETTAILKEPGETAWEKPPDSESPELKGNAAYEKQDYGTAIACFTKLIQTDPANAQWRYLRSLAYYKKSNYAGAETDLDEAIRLKPKNLAQCWFKRGLVDEEMNDKEDAVADYSKAIQVDPGCYDAWFYRAILRESMGQADDALADYNVAIGMNPMDAAAYSNRSMVDLDKDDPAAALADADTAIYLDPANPNAYDNRGIAYEMLGQPRKALADYQIAIYPSCSDGNIFRNLAQLLATCPDPSLRNGKQAVSNASIAGELLEWKNPECLSTMAAAYAEAGDFARAVKYEKMYLATPDLMGASIVDSRRRLALYQQGKSFHAPFEKTFSLVDKGDTASGKGDYDLAITCYTSAIKLDPGDARTHYDRGLAYFFKEEYPKAITDYTEAIRLDPQYSDAFAGLGCARYSTKDYPGSVAALSQAILLAPQASLPYLNRAMAYDEQGDYDKAMADYDMAVQLDPKNAVTYSYRATSLDHHSDFEKALADYNKAIELNPEDAANYNGSAWLLATCPLDGIRNGAQAIKDAKIACTLDQRKDPGYIDTLAAAYAETGNFKQAVQWETDYLSSPNLSKEKIAGGKQRLALYQQRKPYREKPEQ